MSNNSDPYPENTEQCRKNEESLKRVREYRANQRKIYEANQDREFQKYREKYK